MKVIAVPRIEEETSAWERRPFVDRYFKRLYFNTDDGANYSILVHSNKMLVLTLGPSHPILTRNLTVTQVDYQVSEKLNRLDNKVSGKGKRGAQCLSETSIICQINCSNSQTFKVRAGLVGKLLEVNKELAHRPELLKSSSLGYLAIIGPRLSDLDAKLGALLPNDQEPLEPLEPREPLES